MRYYVFSLLAVALLVSVLSVSFWYGQEREDAYFETKQQKEAMHIELESAKRTAKWEQMLSEDVAQVD